MPPSPANDAPKNATLLRQPGRRTLALIVVWSLLMLGLLLLLDPPQHALDMLNLGP